MEFTNFPNFIVIIENEVYEDFPKLLDYLKGFRKTDRFMGSVMDYEAFDKKDRFELIEIIYDCYLKIKYGEIPNARIYISKK